MALASWKDLAAVGLTHGDIVTLNTTTGTRICILSEHTQWVRALAFSSDGTFLVSGSHDKKVKLWDIQTGGVVKTFWGHTKSVASVSISLDQATVASGSPDTTIRLWDTRTGECCCVINEHVGKVNFISFSPTNSQLLISASNHNIISWWDINGHQVGPTHTGQYVNFSSDGTHFVSWGGEVAMVQNSKSGVVVTKLQLPSEFLWCCFSPDNKFIASAAECTVYIWDITGPDPCLVKTFDGHTKPITILAFSSPSSLISASYDKSVKFWGVGTSLMDPVAINPALTPLTSASIKVVKLYANNGTAISGDSAGVVTIWDISTGCCKASFHPPGCKSLDDIQLVGGRLFAVWQQDNKTYIWDAEKQEVPLVVDTTIIPWDEKAIISGDGSKVFFASCEYLWAWSIWTGEFVGMVEIPLNHSPHSLVVDGPRVWVYSENLPIKGWNFGTPGLTPVPLSDTSLDRHHTDFINQTRRWGPGPPRIKDAVTGKEVFQLSGRYSRPTAMWCNSHYLIAGYGSGEVLILDFNNMTPQ